MEKEIRMKKAQAAMEFLITHGWTILVVMLALIALSFVGVQVTRQAPSPCIGEPGLDCIDKAFISAETNQIQFILRNNMGVGLSRLSVIGGGNKCTVEKSNTTYLQPDGSWKNISNIPNHLPIRISVDCSNDIRKGKFKTLVDVQYTNNQSQLTHISSVSINGVAS
ncbi:hypothetical protein GOV09_05270 [Candidatus Woesearchaeota archaeon]|nr:hypothetical protein [Candidatus Woesearchaeota archaeon]